MTVAQRTTGHDQTVLITGASQGIGYEFTKLFAVDGYDVVLVARSQNRLERIGSELEEAHDITSTVISKDLFGRGAAEELYEAVTEQNIQVDTLVNNAGMGIYGHFSETDWEREREPRHTHSIDQAFRQTLG